MSELYHQQTNPQLYDYISPTPTERNAILLPNGSQLDLKLETTQRTGSFKARGAYNALLNMLVAGERQAVTASAGGFACGMADAAAQLGSEVTIFAPETTPACKLKKIRALGGRSVSLRVVGADFPAALLEAEQYAEAQNLPFVSPYDNADVVAGQQTVTSEIVAGADPNRPLVVFAAVGGGGLSAGALAATANHPDARVVGVQFATNTSASDSMEAGRLTGVEQVDIRCEGSAARQIGRLPFELAQLHANRLDYVTVSPAQVGEAIMRETYRLSKLETAMGAMAWDNFPETTGFLAEAGAVAYARKFGTPANAQLVAIRSGSNTDEKREAQLVDAYRLSTMSMNGRTRVMLGAQVIG